MNRPLKVAIAAFLYLLANAVLAMAMFMKPDALGLTPSLGSELVTVLLLIDAVGAVVAFFLLRPDMDVNPALQQIEQEREAAIQQRDAFQNAVQDAERDRQRLNNLYGVAQAELEQAKVELARAKSALRTHDETLTSVRRQLEQVVGAQQQAEATLQARASEVDPLKQWRARAEKELSTLQQQLQDETTQRSRAEAERKAATDRHRVLETRVGVLEQEVVSRQSVLQAILDALPDVVLVVSPDLRPALFNHAAVQLLGVDASDVNVLQALPKYGLYQTDRSTVVPPDALPLVNALRGQPAPALELFVRNSRRPAGVSVRAMARPLGDASARSAVFILQEVRSSMSTPVAYPAPVAAPVIPPRATPKAAPTAPMAAPVVPVAPPAPPPVTNGLSSPVAAAEPPATEPASAPSTGAALRVLLVEDSAVNQKLGVRVIEMTGHRATVAGSGLDALAAIEREEFDLVLMDLTMPGMGGIETTALIREQEVSGKKRVPIVAVTASSKEGSRERCLQWGMDGYIVKPLQPSKLEEVIQVLFHKAPENPPALK
ncbi:MAG TPA: response regulator [Candidatus Xenobia bacterium]|jgi:CheY-like chemotaxis protein